MVLEVFLELCPPYPAFPSAGLVGPAQPHWESELEENVKLKQESEAGGAGLADV